MSLDNESFPRKAGKDERSRDERSCDREGCVGGSRISQRARRCALGVVTSLCVAASFCLVACSFTDLSALTEGGSATGGDGEDGGDTVDVPDGGGGNAEPDAGGEDARSNEEEGGTVTEADAAVACKDGSSSLETEFVAPYLAYTASAPDATVNWTNADGALVAKEGVSAQASSGSAARSLFLVVSKFTFDLPSEALVTGIEIEVVRSTSGLFSSVQDAAIGIAVKGQLGTVFRKNDGDWGGGTTTVVYGGPSDTFGQSFTGEDVRSDPFFLGAAISVQLSPSFGEKATASIDGMRVRLHYCETNSAARTP